MYLNKIQVILISSKTFNVIKFVFDQITIHIYIHISRSYKPYNYITFGGVTLYTDHS